MRKIFAIVRKDNFLYGLALGIIQPLIGMVIYRYTKLGVFSLTEVYQYLIYQPGYKLLTVALSLSLLLNAAVFTYFINSRIDKTAKGIFAATLVYGLTILCLKTFT